MGQPREKLVGAGSLQDQAHADTAFHALQVPIAIGYLEAPLFDPHRRVA